MKAYRRAIPNTAIVLGTFLIFGTAEATAQCWDCFDDTGQNEHRYSIYPVDWGWYDNGTRHTNWLPGYCIFNHSAGCAGGEEDALEVANAILNTGTENLPRLVLQKKAVLEVDSEGGYIGVKGCSGRIVFWLELAPEQITALRHQSEEGV